MGAIVFPKKGNPYWPLPPNYGDPAETEEYRRHARINACSLDGTPDLYVAGWEFFRSYYLCPDDADEFDPAWYDPPILPMAPIHYSLLRWLKEYRYVGAAFPRECAKSTTKRTLFLHHLLTQPRFSIGSFVAKEDFLMREAEALRHQIENNQRIRDDFGDLRPPRGSGIWNMHAMLLTNGSSWTGFSVDGKMRGFRGKMAIFDDVEFDDDVESATASIRLEKLKRRLLKSALPMVGKGGILAFLGTTLGRKSFLWHVSAEDTDPRFRDVRKGGRWFKVVLPATDAAGRNIWPEKYVPEFLAERREMMGDSLFESEYNNRPIADGSAPLRVDPQLNEYSLDPVDTAAVMTPTACDAAVHWREVATVKGERVVQPRSESWKQRIAGMHRLITVDYAPTVTSSSDYSCVMCTGFDARGDMWVLDVWQGRVRQAELTDVLWKMASKWQAKTIAIEAVSVQIAFYQYVKELVDTKLANSAYSPQVVPLTYPAKHSKPDRIMGLEWRFNGGRIKLPRDWRNAQHFSVLYDQIGLFTPSLENLAYDDVIDTLAMANYVMRGGAPRALVESQPLSVKERILAGEMYLAPEVPIPLTQFLDWRSLTEPEQDAILQVLRDNVDTPGAGQSEPEEPGIALHANQLAPYDREQVIWPDAAEQEEEL